MIVFIKVFCLLILWFPPFSQSNSTPHSDVEDDKHSEDFERSPPQKYLEESPPHDVTEAFAQQQRELLERLKEQFSSFPFHSVNFNGLEVSPEQAQQRSQTETCQEFSFPSFPTPPPSKGEDELKISSASAKKNSQNNSWSYEDQFKQVRQVSKRRCLILPFNCTAMSINTSPSRLLTPRQGLWT